MSCLAIIPARGASKGVLRKNLRLLGGLPLVARTILAATQAKHVTRVVVSTDDPEIEEVAERYGAEVVRRPAAISGDSATSESALLHVLETLQERKSDVPPLVMMLQCTSPLTSAREIDGAIETLRATGADCCLTAVPFYHFLWRPDEGGLALPINHEGRKRKRRQDLEPQYLENGALYLMRTDQFLEVGDRFFGKVVCHVVDDAHRLEIDDTTDLAMAEVLVRAEEQGRTRRQLPEPIDALVMDFDGVLTDNRVWVDDEGHESVLCSRGDGMGLAHLRETGVRLLILSKERNPVVARRAEKLAIECLHAIDDKPAALRAWLDDHALRLDHTIFVGNDVNDVGCMTIAGCSACPSDAHPEAQMAAKIILQAPGGQGAVRELCDLITRQP